MVGIVNKATTKRGKSAKVKKNQPVPVTNLIFNNGNPYQRLMYSDPEKRVDLIPGSKAMIGRICAVERTARPRMVHLHWDDRLFGRGADQDANEVAADAILDDLAQYKADGGKIIWTVHNRTAHAARDEATFRAARRRLAGMADVVHVHAAHAAAHVAAEYDVPSEAIRIAPHPSYLGAYEVAETTLGRAPADGATQFLHFGFIRTNKGSDEVVRAAAALSGRSAGDWGLTIRGRAFRGGIRLLRSAAQYPNVIASDDPAPDEEIPAIFGGSHFYLAPVKELFTSGSLMLAQTFGLPVLGPNTPEMRETIAPDCHDLLYPADGHPRRLLRAMTSAIQMDPAEREERRQACFAFSQQRSPAKMSRLLADAIASVM